MARRNKTKKSHWTIPVWLGAALIAAAPLPARALELQDESEGPTKASAEAREGIWPSKKLMELMLSRWAEEAAYEYKLDDQQREKTRKAVVNRWSEFLEDNRDELQPIANEFVEMRMELEPPDKARVQDWARRARPLFDMVTKELEEGTAEYREVLRPDQRIRFEIDAVQMKFGVGMARTKFVQWEQGDFDPDDFWEPLGPAREARRDKRRQRRREMEERRAKVEKEKEEAEKAALDPVEQEMDAWQRYVADFIRDHGLDAGQKETVLSCLTELRDRALAHRDRYRDDIMRLENRVASNSGTESELADIKVQLERLYGPIDEMFRELQSRIEQVLTVEQRAMVQEKNPSEDAPKGDSKASDDSARQKSSTPSQDDRG